MATDGMTPENGDESSNRTFIIAAGALGLLLVLGLIVVVVIFTSRQGRNQNGGQVAQQAPTPEATATSEPPTATVEPTETRSPTATSTIEPTIQVTSTLPIAPPSVEAVITGTLTTETAPVSGTPGDTPIAQVTGTPVTAGTVSASGTPAGRTATPAGTAVRTPLASGTPGGSGSQIPNTGIGDFAGLLLAGVLAVLLIVARRMRLAQS